MSWALLIAAVEAINWWYVLTVLFGIGGASGILHAFHNHTKSLPPETDLEKSQGWKRGKLDVVVSGNQTQSEIDWDDWMDAHWHTFKGMKYKYLKGGKPTDTRQIHVNPHAIRTNAIHGTDYPTIIVVENGVESQYHAVKCHGSSQMTYHSDPDVKANVYMETLEDISVYRNPNSPQFHPRHPMNSGSLTKSTKIFLEAVFVSPVKRVLAGFGFVARKTPLLSCVIYGEQH